MHLLDAVEDRGADRAAGRFNPLEATGTDDEAARVLAERLVADVRLALARAELADGALAEVLLGRELVRAVRRVLPPPASTADHACAVPAGAVPQQRSGSGSLAAGLAVWTVLLQGVFVGGSWGGGGCGPRRGGRYRGGYGDPGYGPGYGRRGYAQPGYGYRSVGPSCGQMLACNCCANLACNACCCGDACDI